MSNEKYAGAGGITLPNEQFPAKITNGYYRVREESNEDAAEIGAYRLLANAIKSCDEHPGSCVYADAGIRIYPAEGGMGTEESSNQDGETDATPEQGNEPDEQEPVADNPGEAPATGEKPSDDSLAGKTDELPTEDHIVEEPKPDKTPDSAPVGDAATGNTEDVDAVENVTVAGYAKLKTLMNIRKAPGGELVTTYKAKVIVAVVEFGGDGWLKILCPESDTGIAYVSNENGEYAFVGSSVYIVQRGDNVWKIAEEQLGDGTRCDEISTLNTLVSNRIQVGMELLLP